MVDTILYQVLIDNFGSTYAKEIIRLIEAGYTVDNAIQTVIC